MCEGAIVSFDWKAEEGSDWYDVLGYLLNVSTSDGAASCGCDEMVLSICAGKPFFTFFNPRPVQVDTGATTIILNAWGEDQDWTTNEFTVPESGNYKLVFIR